MKNESVSDVNVFFHMVPDLLCVASAEGYFKKLNPAWESVLGYSIEELLDRPLVDFIHPDDVADMMKEIGNRIKGEETKFIINRHRCKDNSFKWLEWQLRANEDRSELFAIARDVTGRKMVEQALLETEERYRLLAVNTSDVIWTLDLEGHFTYMSPSVEKLVGYTPAEVIEHGIEGTLTPESAKIAMKTFADSMQILQSGKPLPTVTLTLEQKCKDGSTVWAEMNVNTLLNDKQEVLGLIGVTRDITERRIAENKLRRRIAALESASDAIGISDAEGHHVYQNKAMGDLFEYGSAEELQAAGGWKAFIKNPDQAIHLYENLVQGETWIGEAEMVSKSGRVFPAFVRANSIRDDQGNAIGLLGIITDITERKNAAEQLKQSEEIFRSLAEYSPNMIMIIIKNRIYYANKVCEKKLGYPKEQLYSPEFNIENIVSLEHRELLSKKILQFKTGQELEPFELLMTNKEGRKLYTMVSTNNIQIGKENAILGVILDISEQRWAEEILKRKAIQFDNFSKLMVDRELKMVELKKEVNHLLEKLGDKPKYDLYSEAG